jgi:hypothetical protein
MSASKQQNLTQNVKIIFSITELRILVPLLLVLLDDCRIFCSNTDFHYAECRVII